jgi:hypothetical protein
MDCPSNVLSNLRISSCPFLEYLQQLLAQHHALPKLMSGYVLLGPAGMMSRGTRLCYKGEVQVLLQMVFRQWQGALPSGVACRRRYTGQRGRGGEDGRYCLSISIKQV